MAYCFLGLRRKRRGLDGVGITLLAVMTNKAPAVGCPKKSKSPNFGMPLTPVVFIG